MSFGIRKDRIDINRGYALPSPNHPAITRSETNRKSGCIPCSAPAAIRKEYSTRTFAGVEESYLILAQERLEIAHEQNEQLPTVLQPTVSLRYAGTYSVELLTQKKALPCDLDVGSRRTLHHKLGCTLPRTQPAASNICQTLVNPPLE